MENINKDKVSLITITGEWDIPASVKPFQGAKEHKDVTLRFRLKNTPLTDIIASSLKDKRINWQTTSRPKFEKITDKAIVVLEYKGGKSPVDIEDAYAARLAAMTPEAREAEIKKLMAKVGK